MSKPYIQESRCATNSKVYISKCFRPNLLSFIKENYKVENYSMSDIYKSNKITFIKNKYTNLDIIEINNDTLKIKCESIFS